MPEPSYVDLFLMFLIFLLGSFTLSNFGHVKNRLDFIKERQDNVVDMLIEHLFYKGKINEKTPEKNSGKHPGGMA